MSRDCQAAMAISGGIFLVIILASGNLVDFIGVAIAGKLMFAFFKR